jgi:hypothetical protein
MIKTFTAENANEYVPQIGDWDVWHTIRWTRVKPNVWESTTGRVLDDEEIIDLLRYVPEFKIFREVPDEPEKDGIAEFIAGRFDVVECSFQEGLAHGQKVRVTIEKVKE